MKYTRYDVKKKNDMLIFILVVVCMLLIAFLFGTLISNIFMKNNKSFTEHGATNVSNKIVPKENNKNTVQKFVVVQGGIFENKNYVETTKQQLLPYGNPFTIQDGNKTKLLLGIYNEEDADKVTKLLSSKGVENSKAIFEIDRDDICSVEICEIMDAEIQVLNKLSEKDVKAIQTEELKKWCSSIKDGDKTSKKFSILQDLKTHISSLPKEIVKDKVAENYTYLYNTLIKIKK